MFRHPLAPSPLLPLQARDRLSPRRPLALRWLDEVAEPAQAHELARDAPLAAVEAALLIADEPLQPRKLAALAGLKDAAEARRQITRLRELYERGGSAFQVEELAGGYQLLTRPEFHPWLARLRRHTADGQLSAAARETLTIVAYRQPVTRADVEAIRGVGCGEVLRQLMEKGLVRLAGRDDSLGRPALYETTRKFLQVYGLKGIKDLPPGDGLFPQDGR
jgi:segregation and condensation protein B